MPELRLSVSRLTDLLVAQGVTHVVGLPDTTLGRFFAHLRSRSGPDFVGVAREGEAFAIASGLWLGGRTPVVAIQNTGLLESGDALRGTAQRMGVPLVVLVSYRGVATMGSAGPGAGSLPHDRAHLVRADVDSAALYTEPTLEAWGVPFARLETAGDAARVEEAFERAVAEHRPVALLICGGLEEW